MSMRRLLIIFAALLALALVAVGVWFFFLRDTSAPGDTSGNPFDGTGAGGASGGDVVPEIGVPVSGAGEEVAPRLWKVYERPVARGAVVLAVTTPATGTTTPGSSDTEVRFVDRASGNLYRFRLAPRALERLTNLTLPGVEEASWASDGSRAFLRFLSTESGAERIETYALPANGDAGYLLEPGLSDLVVTGTSSILAVLPSGNGTVGTRSTLEGGAPATVFTTPLSSLSVFAAGVNYAAVTKPSALLPGYAFSIARQTGEMTRVLGPANGLSILPSPSGAWYLHSSRNGNSLSLALYNPSTQETRVLPISTLAEKCVWTADSLVAYCAVPRSVSGNLPDDWYLGAAHTSDRIWRIDIETRIASLEFDPSTLSGDDIDAVSLSVDPKDEALVFTNRRDGTLWLYDL